MAKRVEHQDEEGYQMGDFAVHQASIFHLVRQKVSTYRQIGIKLASLILNWEDDVRDKIEQ